MAQEIQILAIVISIIFNILVINSLRSWSVNIKFSLPWLFIGVVMLLFSCFPNIIRDISYLLKISSPSHTLFFFSAVFTMAMLIMASATIARLKNRLHKVSQLLAIQEHKLRQLQYGNQANLENQVCIKHQ